MSTEPTTDGIQELDIRTVDGEPFSDIMAALNDLNEDETLVLGSSRASEFVFSCFVDLV